MVPENVPIGISVTNVTATDPDEGLGGEIKYEFLDESEASGMFTRQSYFNTDIIVLLNICIKLGTYTIIIFQVYLPSIQ